jgi:hypothetical protein
MLFVALKHGREGTPPVRRLPNLLNVWGLGVIWW